MYCDSLLCLDFFFCFYGLALTRGQGDQDMIILLRAADVPIQVTLSRATAICFRLGCAPCPRGLTWATGWQLNIFRSRIAVVLRRVTLSRDLFFVYGLADEDIIILSRTGNVLIQVTLSRAAAIFFRLGCALCPRDLTWATGW